MKRLFLIFLLAGSLINGSQGPLWARGKAGTASGEFLKLGAGARYLAMGEAAVSLTGDANALYWNPANLEWVRHPSLSFTHSRLIESINHQYVGYAQPIGPLGTLAVSLQSLSAGSILETDDTGLTLGTFSPKDQAMVVGWGRAIGAGLSVGLSGKSIQSKILSEADTTAGDAGLAFRRGEFAAGVSLSNVGRSLKFDREKQPLPVVGRVGVSYKLDGSILWALDGIFPKRGEPNIGTGAEYEHRMGSKSSLFLRAGYGTRTKDVRGLLQGFSLGLGWRWLLADLDYAWIPLGELGQTHRISMTLRFRKEPDQKQNQPDNKTYEIWEQIWKMEKGAAP